jgi:hypothetical protein
MCSKNWVQREKIFLAYLSGATTNFWFEPDDKDLSISLYPSLGSSILGPLSRARLSQNLSHLCSNQNPPNLSNLLLRHIPSQSTKNPTHQMVFGVNTFLKSNFGWSSKKIIFWDFLIDKMSRPRGLFARALLEKVDTDTYLENYDTKKVKTSSKKNVAYTHFFLKFPCPIFSGTLCQRKSPKGTTPNSSNSRSPIQQHWPGWRKPRKFPTSSGCKFGTSSVAYSSVSS